MAVLIDFVSDDDRLRAIDVLVEEEETYQRVPKSCFFVSNAAEQSLEAHGIRFRVIGRREREGDQHGPRP